MGWRSTCYKGKEYLWWQSKGIVTMYYIPTSGKPELIYTGVPVGAQAALAKHAG